MLETAGEPIEILRDLIFNGIDIFESKYIFDLSVQNKAFAFNPKMSSTEELKIDLEELFSKEGDAITIDLSDKKFQMDSTRIVKDCTCHTCTSVNRSYIYHLIDCQELNQEILLNIHNHHTMTEFFKEIRAHIEDGSLIKYTGWFINNFIMSE